MNPRPIYLDYQATTPVDPEVREAMLPFLKDEFGNPHSSNHAYGWEASDAIKIARGQVAHLINADDNEIVFTSGATESCNLALRGVAGASDGKTQPDHHGRHRAPGSFRNRQRSRAVKI